MKKKNKLSTKYVRKVWAINPRTRKKGDKPKYNRQKENRIKEDEEE